MAMTWADLLGGGNSGQFGGSVQNPQNTGVTHLDMMGGEQPAGGPQGQGGYLAQLLQRMKANRGAFSTATGENIGAGSLSRGFGGGGGGARGGLVNNTPGVVQLLSLLANRNRQF
jgi:hypothetical protein